MHTTPLGDAATAEANFVRTASMNAAPWLATFLINHSAEVISAGSVCFGLYVFARPFGPALEITAVTIPHALVRTRDAGGIQHAFDEERALVVGGPVTGCTEAQFTRALDALSRPA